MIPRTFKCTYNLPNPSYNRRTASLLRIETGTAEYFTLPILYRHQYSAFGSNHELLLV